MNTNAAFVKMASSLSVHWFCSLFAIHFTCLHIKRTCTHTQYIYTDIWRRRRKLCVVFIPIPTTKRKFRQLHSSDCPLAMDRCHFRIVWDEVVACRPRLAPRCRLSSEHMHIQRNRAHQVCIKSPTHAISIPLVCNTQDYVQRCVSKEERRKSNNIERSKEDIRKNTQTVSVCIYVDVWLCNFWPHKYQHKVRCETNLWPLFKFRILLVHYPKKWW